MARLLSMMLALAFLTLAPEVATATATDDCGFETPLSEGERIKLLKSLRISTAGSALLKSFTDKFASLNNLTILWNRASFSEISAPKDRSNRQPANAKICIHLAENLPEIEHVADLAHELTHATKLDYRVLRGDVRNAEEFIHSRLAAEGGEADAFAQECLVKYQILGRWDDLCSPYVNLEPGESSDSNTRAGDGFVDTLRVLKDLYSGQLSASLTGEPYPVLLAKQFKAMLKRKAKHAHN